MEKRAFRLPGFVAVAAMLAIIPAMVLSITSAPDNVPLIVTVATVGSIVVALLASGLVVISPNDARVIQFFGHYVGTIDLAGFHWTWPVTEKTKISKRIRNFETARLKVSDADGNPVEIASVVVWKVT